MTLFIKPTKLFEIVKAKDAVQAYLTPRTKEWYFSNAGHMAYQQAKTVPDRTKFFYNYLWCISSKKQKPDFLERIAFIMANSMTPSNLPFARYPNILDGNQNPFVALVESGFVSPIGNNDHDKNFKFEVVDTAVLLAALHNDNDWKNYYSIDKKPYLQLNYSTNGTYSDIQKIERDIIWSRKFSLKNDEVHNELYNPPFCYDILSEIIMTTEMEQKESEGVEADE